MFSCRGSYDYRLDFRDGESEPVIVVVSVRVLSGAFVSKRGVDSTVATTVMLPACVSGIYMPVRLGDLFFGAPRLSVDVFTV